MSKFTQTFAHPVDSIATARPGVNIPFGGSVPYGIPGLTSPYESGANQSTQPTAAAAPPGLLSNSSSTVATSAAAVVGSSATQIGGQQATSQVPPANSVVRMLDMTSSYNGSGNYKIKTCARYLLDQGRAFQVSSRPRVPTPHLRLRPTETQPRQEVTKGSRILHQPPLPTPRPAPGRHP